MHQRVDDVKIIHSQKMTSVDAEILEILKAWKRTTEFSADEGWMFASPAQFGELPVSYPWVWQMFQKAAAISGIAGFGTHALRHTYRSWLDAVGTPIAVQQKLMRHWDIRTTMNIYGDVTDEMAQADAKIAELALKNSVFCSNGL